MLNYSVLPLFVFCMSLHAMELTMDEDKSWEKDKPAFGHVRPEWYDMASDVYMRYGGDSSSLLQQAKAVEDPPRYVFNVLLEKAFKGVNGMTFQDVNRILELSKPDTTTDFFHHVEIKQFWVDKAVKKFFELFRVPNLSRHTIEQYFDRGIALIEEYNLYCPYTCQQMCLEMINAIIRPHAKEEKSQGYCSRSDLLTLLEVRCLLGLYSVFPELIEKEIKDALRDAENTLNNNQTACIPHISFKELLFNDPNQADELMRHILLDPNQSEQQKASLMQIVLTHSNNWQTICRDYFLESYKQGEGFQAIGAILSAAKTNEHTKLGFELLAMYVGISESEREALGICERPHLNKQEEGELIYTILLKATVSPHLQYCIMQHFNVHFEEIYERLLLDETAELLVRMEALKNMLMNCHEPSIACLETLPDSMFKSMADWYIGTRKKIFNA